MIKMPSGGYVSEYMGMQAQQAAQDEQWRLCNASFGESACPEKSAAPKALPTAAARLRDAATRAFAS
jgi:hypothetical protein